MIDTLSDKLKKELSTYKMSIKTYYMEDDGIFVVSQRVGTQEIIHLFFDSDREPESFSVNI